MRLDRDGDESSQPLDLTPLIDMVFLLLVFFLAATTFAKEEVEMDLDLPEATSGVAQADDHLLIVNVLRDGTLRVDGRPVGLEGLRQRLLAAAARNKDQAVLIRGDTMVQFGVVAQAFDACLAAKLRRVSVAAEPEAKGRK
jgi:biopolymer transport protein ExbD